MRCWGKEDLKRMREEVVRDCDADGCLSADGNEGEGGEEAAELDVFV